MSKCKTCKDQPFWLDEYAGYVPCPECGRHRVPPDDNPFDCDKCKGTGTVEVEVPTLGSAGDIDQPTELQEDFCECDKGSLREFQNEDQSETTEDQWGLLIDDLNDLASMEPESLWGDGYNDGLQAAIRLIRAHARHDRANRLLESLKKEVER